MNGFVRFLSKSMIIALVVAMFCSLFCNSILAYAGAGDTVLAANHNLYPDGEGGYYYVSIDKEITSKIGYETMGVTIHDSDANGNMSETNYISFNFEDDGLAKDTIREGKDVGYGLNFTVPQGMVATITKIPAAAVHEKMVAQDPSWAARAEAGTAKIWGNAIMTTFQLINGNKNYEGVLYDWSMWQALAHRYGWADPSGIYSHYFKVLLNGAVLPPDTPNYLPTDSGFEPDYYTAHDSAEYDIGEGIPSGKSIYNEVTAYGWEGKLSTATTSLKERQYNVNYQVTIWYPTGDGWACKIVHGTIPVMRSCKYGYIVSVDIKEISNMKAENPSYGSLEYYFPRQMSSTCHINDEDVTSYMAVYVPEDDKHIIWPDEPSLVCFSIIGQANWTFETVKAVKNLDEMGDDYNGSLDWPKADSESIVGFVQSWNDDLHVDTPAASHDYMIRDEIVGRRTQDVWWPRYLASTPPMEYDGYRVEQSQDIQIPISKANGVYDSSVTATYTRIMPPDDQKTDHTKQAPCDEGSMMHPIGRIEGDGSSNKNYLDENEPIVVHTPVISPVSLYDINNVKKEDGQNVIKDRTKKLEVGTQMISPTKPNGTPVAWDYKMRKNNPDIESYNLILDGTYVLNFEPYKWLDSMKSDENENGNSYRSGNRDHGTDTTKDPVSIHNVDGKTGYDLPGYGDSDYPLRKYDEFIGEKQVRFPFPVSIIDNGMKGEKWYQLNDIVEDEFKDYKVRYTDWITIDPYTSVVKFYIPTWALESSSVFGADSIADIDAGNYYKIQFRVEAYNTSSEQKKATEDLNNADLNKYVATFDIPVNVSGIIYDFQILGVNDRDMFYGYSNDFNESIEWSFCPSKEEKKSGELNRIGEDSVRQTIDGLLKVKWPLADCLPLSKGSSHKYPAMGALWKGTRFSWSVKTIANLADMQDYIKIRPRWRYITADGQSPSGDITQDYGNIKLYYTDKTGKFIEYLGDEISMTSERGDIAPKEGWIDGRDPKNVKDFQFNSEQFYGAWYEGNKFLRGNSTYPRDNEALNVVGYYLPDDLGYTVRQYVNDGGSLNGVEEDPVTGKRTLPISKLDVAKESWLTKNNFAYNFSDITSTSSMRILSGNCDFLERNLKYIMTDHEYDTMPDCKFGSMSGSYSEQAKDSDSFRSSMQTWYGQYLIPNDLYVCDAEIEFEIPTESGVPIIKKATLDTKEGEEGYDPECDLNEDGVIDLSDYAETNQLSDHSKIWKQDGYLILNFDIITYNWYVDPTIRNDEGKPQKTLRYNANVNVYPSDRNEDGSNKPEPDEEKVNEWEREGGPKKVYIDYETGGGGHEANGDPTKKKTVTKEIPVNPGDIAIIDLRYKLTDKYTANLFLVD